MTTTRAAFRARLLPMARQEYLERHALPPPNLIAAMRSANLTSYCIFEHDGWLLSCLEHDGVNISGDLAALASSAPMQQWSASCRPLLRPSGTASGSPWIPTTPVFDLRAID